PMTTYAVATDKASFSLSTGLLPGILTPGQTISYTLSQSYGQSLSTTINTNLNANGFRDSKGSGWNTVNKPSSFDMNDMPGFYGNSSTVFEPVFYLTVPAQMSLVTDETTGLPYTTQGVGWKGISSQPKVTTFVNADGLTVYKVDFTGTGFTWYPINQQVTVTLKVNDDAFSAVVPFMSTKPSGEGSYNDVNYVDKTNYSNSQLTGANNSAAHFGATGESIMPFMVYGNAISSDTQTNLNDLQNLYILKQDGTKEVGLSSVQGYGAYAGATGMATLTGNKANGQSILIQAPQGMILQGTIKSNHARGNAYQTMTSNYPLENGQDKHQLRIRLANNTSSLTTNVGAVWNLPQVVTSNTDTTPGTFKLILTGANQDPDGVVSLYTTHSAVLSSNGKSVVLDNGHTYYFNVSDGTSTTTPADLMTADQVTDWSSIQGGISIASSIQPMGTDDVILNVSNPNSFTDKGKVVQITTAFRADRFDNVTNSVTDAFDTTGKIQFLDQDGHNINGYPDSVGSFNAQGRPTGPTGGVGQPIINNLQQIPGYVFVKTDGDTVFNVKGNATLVNHYQVNRAQLVTTNKPSGTQVSEIALADPTPNTGATDSTAVDNITFTNTDATLAAAGWTYKVVAPDGKTYNDLASALTANATYDTVADSGSTISQVFTVNYTLNANALQLGTITKVFDGDATTDPAAKFTGTLPAGITEPTWARTDFNDPTSQNVGSYDVTLSAAGLVKLQAANPGKTITADNIAKGTFTITARPITVAAPTLTKTYDGKAYTGADNKITVTGMDGVLTTATQPVYTSTDISKIVNANTAANPSYAITITANAADNGNYTITKTDGSLTINPLPLDPATPNTPDTPVNPKTPNNNPQFQTSVIVKGATKVYDGDATTDPTSFTVQGPAKYTDFVIPTLVDGDFDKSGITSQNVGNYTVKLTTDGFKKIQDANPNYTLTSGDVQDGLFVITPAPVSVTGPTLTKVYDGNAYTEADLTKPKAVLSYSGKPAKGNDIVASLADLSTFKNVGTYTLTVTAAATDNPNYTVTSTDGKLTITAQPLAANVTIKTATKVYDGDVTTDPTTFTVEGPTGVTDFDTTGLTASDFDVTGITSQNVGNYTIKLTAAGLAKLQANNKNYSFTSDKVTNGSFTITQAPVTITAPTLTKSYDGKPYDITAEALKAQATVAGKPTKGDALNFTLTDISKDINKATYPIVVTAADADNSNYKLTKVDGNLMIGVHPLTPATPNTPDTPVNPNEPNENPQLETSLVVSGKMKTYDGDKSTDPTTFNVLGPKQYTDFTIPALTADDFDVSGITSQDVGLYTVKLSASGLKKIQDANTNYDLKAEDVQDGLFNIVKRDIGAQGPHLTKVYDGKAYSEPDPKNPKAIITYVGVPKLGTTPVVTIDDFSADIYAGGTYVLPLTVSDKGIDNKNYHIVPTDGSLTITVKPLDPATPNTPDTPINPKTPNDNPALETALVIKG
ncbi:MBG domain-containing protein, partial [Furfurilactobacillus siliginis]|uniref:MBG domain-containing protein n=1 Tax=Furfurilactobacillus siliginis TaxID=348151 RepID=UPI001649A3C9